MSVVAFGDLVFVREFRTYFDNPQCRGWLDTAANKGREYVTVLLGTRPRVRTGAEVPAPFDGVQALYRLGWHRERECPGGEFAVAERAAVEDVISTARAFVPRHDHGACTNALCQAFTALDALRGKTPG